MPAPTSYSPTTWTNGVTPASAANMNHLESGISQIVTDYATHQAAATLDHPDGSVTAAKLAAGAVTDTVVGNRTPDETQTAASGAQTLTKCLSFLANMIKQITGGTHWYTAPVATLSSLDSRATTLEGEILSKASAGGGSTGSKLWVGTTDPAGSASEGDIWVKA